VTSFKNENPGERCSPTPDGCVGSTWILRFSG
jgi:hypothetical protein